MLQINRNKLTLTPGGEEQVALSCFLQAFAFISSQVRLGGEEVLFFQEPFLGWLYRIQRQRSVLNG